MEMFCVGSKESVDFCACRSLVAASTQTEGREGRAGTPQVQTRMGLESVLRHWGVHWTRPGAGGQGEYKKASFFQLLSSWVKRN